MSQQLSAGRCLHGQKYFSSSSAVSGLSCCRSSVFPSAAPFERGYEVWSYSSRSLQNVDGRKQISSGYGGRGCRDVHFNNKSGSHGSMVGLCGRSCKSEGLCRMHVSENLLQPLCVKIDPEIQHTQMQEREQLKSLSNRFACFIDKVQHLEQRNRELVSKWDLLLKQVIPSQKNLKHVLDSFICSLKRQLDSLLHERGQMEPEQNKMEKLVEEFKCKYEQEVTRHTAAKNEFMLLKKDMDCVYLTKAELEAKLETLKQETEFLKCVSAQEIAELDRRLCDTSVIVKMDNSRGLAMEGILKGVDCWYKDIAQKSKAKLDALYRIKYQELEESTGRSYNELKSHQQETEEMRFVIQRWQHDLENMKKQVSSLQTSICDTEQRGDCALKDAREKHTELQNALQKAKDELACMLRDYQELLNVRLALDIEIATYKTLLEGEEGRICIGKPVSMLVTTPCNIIPGLGCGPGPAGRQSRRRWSFCGVGRALLPADVNACHRGFTSRSITRSVGRWCTSGAPSCSYISRSGEFSSRSGGHLCQSSALQVSGKHCGRTKEMCGESCRAVKSSGNSAHPRGVCRPGVRISTGPLCPRNSRI